MKTLTLVNDEDAAGTSAPAEFYDTDGPFEAVIQASGGYTVDTTVNIEASLDGENWNVIVPAIAAGDMVIGPFPQVCQIRANVTVVNTDESVIIIAGINGDGRIRFVDLPDYIPA